MQDRNDDREQGGHRKAAGRSSRRKLLKAGVFLAPAVVTLYARPVFGQFDETLNSNYDGKDYIYGDLAGQGKDTFDAAEDWMSTQPGYIAGGDWTDNGDGTWTYYAEDPGPPPATYEDTFDMD